MTYFGDGRSRLHNIDEYLDSNRDRLIADLRDFCRIPSITNDRDACAEAAAYVRQHLEHLGAEVEVHAQADGNAIILGTFGTSSGRRLLTYNHYDVQPVEPLEEWTHPPFAAHLTDDGRIVARGVADNKANLLARLVALEALRAVGGPLSTDVVFLIEGEEEGGSPHLAAFVESHRSRLSADGALWEAGEVGDDGRPILRLGQKGMLYVELQLRTMKSDLHSMWAPVVTNAGIRLMEILQTLWVGSPTTGRVAIPGFYDQVMKPGSSERELLRKLPFDEDGYRSLFGLRSFKNDLKGLALKTALFGEPSINLAGFSTGHTATGTKTVLPGAARALLDIRLVPNQRPDEIFSSLEEHFSALVDGGLSTKMHSAHRPAYSPPDARIVHIARDAARYAFGAEPILQPRALGSGPMWTFTELLGVPTLEGAGAGHPGRNIHAPNENIYIDNYFACIRQVARIMQTF